MKAKLVHDFNNVIGEKKKELSSSMIYTIVGTQNLSGRGDLFIKNMHDKIIKKCYSIDWNNPRKYSSIIDITKQNK